MELQRVANVGLVRTVKTYFRVHNVQIVALLETRISDVKAEKVIKRLGFDRSHRLEAQGFSGGL